MMCIWFSNQIPPPHYIEITMEGRGTLPFSLVLVTIDASRQLVGFSRGDPMPCERTGVG